MDLSASQVKRKKQETKAEEAALLAGLEDLYKAGFVSEGDYESRKAEITKVSSKARAQKVFKRFDTDGSGEIDAKELQAMIFALGEAMSDADVANLLKTLDTTGNGSIDFEEFYAWWSTPDRGASTSSDFLKLKLQSKSYMKTVAAGPRKLGESVRRVKEAKKEAEPDHDTGDLSFSVNLRAGKCSPDCPQADLEFDPDGGAGLEPQLIIQLLSKVPFQEIKDTWTPFFEYGVSESAKAENRADDDPFLKFEYDMVECDGGKALVNLRLFLMPEMAAMAAGFVEAAGISKCSFHTAIDIPADSIHISAGVQVSHQITELLAELPDVPPEFPKICALYAASDLDLKFRSLTKLKQHPELAKIVPSEFFHGEKELIKSGLKELENDGPVAAGWRLLQKHFDTIPGIAVILGNMKFSLNIKWPGFWALIDCPDLIHHEEKPIPDGCPETIMTAKHEHELKLVPRGRAGRGAVCTACNAYTFGPVYECQEEGCKGGHLEPCCALEAKAAENQ